MAVNDKHPDFKTMERNWNLVEALRNAGDGLRNETWLPKLEGETNSQYSIRKRLSAYTDYFDKGVENQSAKPFTEDVKVTGVDLMGWMDDVDKKGSSITDFCKMVIKSALRFGLFHIRVSLPSVPASTFGDMLEVMSMHDLEREKLFPYLSLIRPTNLFSWVLDEFEKPLALSVLTMRYDQDFGQIRVITVYMVEGYEVWEKKPNETDYTKNREGMYAGEGTTPMLDQPPIVTGYGVQTGPMTGISHIQSVAEMNSRHFRLQSELDAYESSALSRVKVFKGVDKRTVKNQKDGNAQSVRTQPTQELLLGDKDADFAYVAPGTDASAAAQVSIEKLEAKMEKRIGNLSLGMQDGPETATGQIIATAEAEGDLWALAHHAEEKVAEALGVGYRLMGRESPEIGVEFDSAPQAVNLDAKPAQATMNDEPEEED